MCRDSFDSLRPYLRNPRNLQIIEASSSTLRLPISQWPRLLKSLPPIYSFQGRSNTNTGQSYEAYACSAIFVVKKASRSNLGSSGSDITAEGSNRQHSILFDSPQLPRSRLLPLIHAMGADGDCREHIKILYTHHHHLSSSGLRASSSSSTPLSPSPLSSPCAYILDLVVRISWLR